MTTTIPDNGTASTSVRYWRSMVDKHGIEWLRTAWRSINDLRKQCIADGQPADMVEHAQAILNAMNQAGADHEEAAMNAMVQAGEAAEDVAVYTAKAALDTRAAASTPAPTHSSASVDHRASAGPAITEDGMYRTADGAIYKVQYAIHGSGRLYAKLLVVEREPVRDAEGTIVEPAKVRFDYAPGMVNKLQPSDKLTVEAAKAFGALYGTCVRCGKGLTLEDSIKRMMGRTCYGKTFGGAK